MFHQSGHNHGAGLHVQIAMGLSGPKRLREHPLDGLGGVKQIEMQHTLVGLNIADYITGILAAPKRGERVSSSKGMNGIVKKCLQYILVFVGIRMDWLVGYSATSLGFAIPQPSVVGTLVCVWLIVNEMLSILENLADAGVSTPPFLEPLIVAIRQQTEARGEASGQEDGRGQHGA